MTDIQPDILNEQIYNNLTKCVNAHIQTFHKGEYIQILNAKRREIGIIVSGQLTMYKTDINGNTVIFDKLLANNIFSQSFITNNEDNLFLITDKDSQIIFLDYNYFVKGCNELCPRHRESISHILNLIIQYTNRLNLKLDILSKKTIKDKLLTYFNFWAAKNNTNSFEISLTYTELAEYLAIDRSAMMRKLKDLEDQEYIKKNGRHITILKRF